MKKTTIFFLSAVLLFSCGKNPVECTASVAAISGTYKIAAYTYKQTPASPEIDYYSTIFPDACDRDNTSTFSTNGTYVITDAGMACLPPRTDNGTWSLSGNNIMLDGDPTTIESFDCKTLVISIADFQTIGDKLKMTLVK